MKKYIKEDLLSQLQNNICTITFTKINGEQRVMPCTLKEGIVPLFESKGTRKPTDELLSVWCTDKSAWRSFRVDSVTDLAVGSD